MFFWIDFNFCLLLIIFFDSFNKRLALVCELVLVVGMLSKSLFCKLIFILFFTFFRSPLDEFSIYLFILLLKLL